MDLVIETDGTVRCLYDETLDLSPLGEMQIQRGSHVEPDNEGRWYMRICLQWMAPCWDHSSNVATRSKRKPTG
jgi:hypothetical protein